MFLEKAKRGYNQWFLYVFTLVVVFLGVQVGSIPVTAYALAEAGGDLAAAAEGLTLPRTNAGLALTLLAFAVGVAVLLFCVGTMAILGSLESGLQNDHATLFAKSVMDTISACVFASTLGLGVLFSAVPLFLYQGGITLLSSVVGPYLTEGVIAEMNTVGSLLLLGLSLDLLGIKKLKLMKR